uniref:Uncharacterized protein n=1 Tax=Rhizophora mucronata TaxID=61149 RepID=A0A2P2LCC1_RHIMU
MSCRAGQRSGGVNHEFCIQKSASSFKFKFRVHTIIIRY